MGNSHGFKHEHCSCRKVSRRPAAGVGETSRGLVKVQICCHVEGHERHFHSSKTATVRTINTAAARGVRRPPPRRPLSPRRESEAH